MPEKRKLYYLQKNLKFIYLFSLIVCGLGLLSQFYVINVQNKASRLNTLRVNTELRVSEYRNFLWLLHNKPDSTVQVLSEFQDVKENQRLVEVKLIDEHFRRIEPAINRLGPAIFASEHDHLLCLRVMKESRDFIESTRKLKRIESLVYKKLELKMNKLVLGLSTLSFFLFIYGYIHAKRTL